jgi:hypothetical protein
MVTDREYSFNSQTQFSKGCNVEDTTACNIDHIIWGDTCVSYLQQYRFLP